MNTRTIQLTDAQGRLVVPEEDAYQPLPGSVVLTEGLHGTCWQRYFSDDLWHSTTGRTGSWAWLLSQRNVVLVHDASERESRPARQSRSRAS
jgi:hypothetical protein